MENIRIGKKDATDEEVFQLQSWHIVMSSQKKCRMAGIQ